MIEGDVRRASAQYQRRRTGKSPRIPTQRGDDQRTDQGVPRAGVSPWPRISLISGVVLVVLSLLIGGGLTVFNTAADSKVHKESLLPPNPQGKDISGPINVLLIGVDVRTNSHDLIRADSTTIVHINGAHTKASLVTLPRDSLVSVPPFPDSKFAGMNRAKLTEAYAFGNQTYTANGAVVGDDSAAGRARGVRLLDKVLSNLTPGGLTFNAVAIVNFNGFQKLIDAMGGINKMCVDETVRSEHFNNQGKYVGETYGNPKVAKIYPKGCYPMQPWEALDFARQRHYLENNDADYGRARHQQQLMMTVFKQLSTSKTLTDPAKLNNIMSAAGDFLTVDLGGNSVLDWVFTLKNLNPDNLTMIKTNAGKFSSVTYDGVEYEQVVPDSRALLEAVHNDTVDTFVASHPTWVSP
jgi:anionic cell wall polymer biosynthesis LytR-Cps2A-Psr (LCP) family protein